LDYYKARGVLQEINGQQSAESVQKDILQKVQHG
jgi:hypothetical protein